MLILTSFPLSVTSATTTGRQVTARNLTVIISLFEFREMLHPATCPLASESPQRSLRARKGAARPWRAGRGYQSLRRALRGPRGERRRATRSAPRLESLCAVLRA